MGKNLIKLLIGSALFLNGCSAPYKPSKNLNFRIESRQETSPKKNPLEGKNVYTLDYGDSEIYIIDANEDGEFDTFFELKEGVYRKLEGEEKEETRKYFEDHLAGRDLA